MSLQSRASLGFGFGAESVAMLGYGEDVTVGGQGVPGGGGFISWDGKTYPSPEMAPPKPHKRIYFDASQARAIVQAETLIESIQAGREDKEALFTQAATAINEIRAEVVKIEAATMELQREEKIQAMHEMIEEIDAAFMLFVIVTLH